MCDDYYLALVPRLGNIMMGSLVLGCIILMPLLDVYGRRKMNLILTSVQMVALVALEICISIEWLMKLPIIVGFLLILAFTSLPRMYTSLIYSCDLTTSSRHKYIYVFGFICMFLTAGILFYFATMTTYEFLKLYIYALVLLNLASLTWFFFRLPESPLFLYK